MDKGLMKLFRKFYFINRGVSLLQKCGAEMRRISAKIPQYPVATRLELVDKSCCRDRDFSYHKPPTELVALTASERHRRVS